MSQLHFLLLFSGRVFCVGCYFHQILFAINQKIDYLDVLSCNTWQLRYLMSFSEEKPQEMFEF